ncbi:hypothetical protein [Rhodococcoides fascians]|nr:hypothetical protein [Rhodococcus fascians]
MTKPQALAMLQEQRAAEDIVFGKRATVIHAARRAGYSWREIHTILGLL